MQTMYFGHPINTYDTALEERLLRAIGREFPQFHIENPNTKEHQQKYRRYKVRTGNGMNYFYNVVLPKMHSGIFLPFSDEKFSAGVYREAEFLKNKNKQVWEISENGLIKAIEELDNSRALTVDQTRKRLEKLIGKRT